MVKPSEVSHHKCSKQEMLILLGCLIPKVAVATTGRSFPLRPIFPSVCNFIYKFIIIMPLEEKRFIKANLLNIAPITSMFRTLMADQPRRVFVLKLYLIFLTALPIGTPTITNF